MGNSPSQNHLSNGAASGSSDFRIFSHSSAIVGNEVFIWGGSRPGVPSDYNSIGKTEFTASIDVLDLSNYSTFIKRETTGIPPSWAIKYSCCCIGSDIYYFGGSWGTCFGYSNLFVLNTKNYGWREIKCNTMSFDNRPIEKEGCGMIPFSMNGKDYVLVIGGQGPLPAYPPSHAHYAQGRKSDCFNNEVHITCVSTPPAGQYMQVTKLTRIMHIWLSFLFTGKWTIPVRSGCTFPPSAYFSINTVPGSDRTAIIFGGMYVENRYGTNEDEVCQSNSVFILKYTNYSVVSYNNSTLSVYVVIELLLY